MADAIDIPLANHDGKRANATPFQRYNVESRWPLASSNGVLYVDLSGGLGISPGTRSVPVLHCTDLASRIAHNQGIEAFVMVGDEGSYAIIRCTDGTTIQRKIRYISVAISWPEPT